MRRAASAPACRRATAAPPCSIASLRRHFASSHSSISHAPVPLSLKVPSFARQADGAALVSQGATSVLATVVANRVEPRWHREMNLIVDYREPNAGFGRIPQNAHKRDGAPLPKETQNAAIIEACMAAAFPDEFLCETQLHVSVVSQEEHNLEYLHSAITCALFKSAHDPLVPALNAAALAYRIAPFPFKHEPWAAARCVIEESGRVHQNPSLHAVRGAAGSILIAATRSKIVWMEATSAQGRVLSEKALDQIIKAGLESVHYTLAAQDKLATAAPLSHPLSAKLIEPSKEVMDAAALFAGESYKQIALLPRRAMFEGMTKLNRSLMASLRQRYFRLQDFDADLACEALQSSADTSYFIAKIQRIILYGWVALLRTKFTARWAVLEAGARADGRLPAEARPLAVDLDPLPNAQHVRALIVGLGDTKAMAQHASGLARDRESDTDAMGHPKRLYVQVSEPPSASTLVARHSKKVEQREAHLSALIERVIAPSVLLKHPNALSRVAVTLLDGDGAHVPAYVMATSLALAKQGQLAEAYSSLEMAVYEGGKGIDGAVLCDPTALESNYADSHLYFTASSAGLMQLRVSSKAGLEPARLPSLLAQAKPALAHLSATLKGLALKSVVEKVPPLF